MKQKRKKQAHFDSHHGTRPHTSILAGKNVPDMYAKQREKQAAGIGLDRRCNDGRSEKAVIGAPTSGTSNPTGPPGSVTRLGASLL
ncbi:hypothetical protein SLT36_31290 (plasmid) [Aminobacter sp. BA135]|uniref:hypothetical protein n=1 Tax=Aminobacter sp. BA135 TaxID=537596 RepID=UPI003D792916